MCIETDREACRATALDPFASTTDASAASGKADALTLEAQRLEKLTGLVAEAVTEAQAKEAEGERAKAYTAAKRERDTLTAWASQRYPELVAELVEYAARMDANNRTLDRVNDALPFGRERLAYADTQARGWDPARTYDRSVTGMKLPDPANVEALAWPKPLPNFAAELMKAAV